MAREPRAAIRSLFEVCQTFTVKVRVLRNGAPPALAI